MPGFDGTGPMGMGPMTGGGRGWCAVPLGGGAPALAGRPFGFGRGGGRGGGRGHRWMYCTTGLPGWMRFGGAPAWVDAAPVAAPQAVEPELQMLRRQAESMRSQLDTIQARMAALEAPQPAE